MLHFRPHASNIRETIIIAQTVCSDFRCARHGGLFSNNFNFLLIQTVILCFSSCSADVVTALGNDPAATEFLDYLTQCYGAQNQSYFR